MIRLVRGNVEKIVYSEEQAKKLMSEGFKIMEAIKQGVPEEKKKNQR